MPDKLSAALADAAPQANALITFLWRQPRQQNSFDALPKESFQSSQPADSAIIQALKRARTVIEGCGTIEISEANRTATLTVYA